jgi:3-hydroxypropanoate dehydrogenase
MTMEANTSLGEGAHAPLFEGARTHNAWLPRKVSADTLRDLYDRLRWAPTSANSNPGRFVFLRSPAAKQRLKAHLSPQNVDKTMSAPVCVIVAADAQFYDRMPELSPQRDFRAIFTAAPALADETATRNAILQGAYLILAARSLGLDCGPMSGFDRKAVDAEFFPDGHWQSNFLVNLGYGDESKLWPRNPRLAFDDACQIL